MIKKIIETVFLTLGILMLLYVSYTYRSSLNSGTYLLVNGVCILGLIVGWSPTRSNQ